MNSKKLLLLDFDGTITTKDTFPLFIKFDKGFLVYFAVFSLFSPLLILYKLKLMDGGRVKQSILSFLYKNYSKDKLFKKGIDFIAYLNEKGVVKAKFSKLISAAKINNYETSVVSASPNIWIKAFCENHKINYVCTELEFNDEQLFTGKFKTPNCVRKEKVIRIKQKYNLTDFIEIIAYGNSMDDEEMYKIATSFYRV